MTLHGFHYDAEVEARLRAGWRYTRIWVDPRGHRHRVSLSWSPEHDCPHVSDLDMDLVVRITG